MASISTPCAKICVIDEEAGLCLGCGRTLQEIARWMRLGEAERRAIMAELGARLERLATRMNEEERRCPE